MIKLNLQVQIFIGLIAGVMTGLFFGEMAQVLDKVGNAFIMLLKMTILPFMSGSLIHAIGSLSVSGAKNLLKNGVVYFLLFWFVVIATILVLPLGFPHLDAPLYFGGTADTGGGDGDILGLFIPRNPFHALANDLIPAVVLFSLLFGIALMQLRNKEPLLEAIDTINHALIRITQWVALLSPIGVFALVAASVGTMPFQHLSKIQVYLTAYLIGSVFLTFWMLPTLVTMFCPVGYAEFIRTMRPAILIAFTTGNNLVALPYLFTCLEEMAKRHELEEKSAHSTIGSLVPITYNFPTAGNLLGILFIFFLGFFYSREFDFLAYLKITAISMPVLFGAAAAVINAISFLIDQMRLPADGLSLFLETLPITRNFQALTATMGMGTVCVLVTFSCHQQTRFRPIVILRKAVKSVVLLGILIVGASLLSHDLTQEQEKFTSLRLLKRVESNVSLEPRDLSAGFPDNEGSLRSIQREGVMRVGYSLEHIPFSYFNKDGELVGYDIAFAHAVAEALAVRIEFVPFEFRSLGDDLEQNKFDMGVGSISVTEERLRRILFSEPYRTEERVLVTRDYRRFALSDLEPLVKSRNFNLAALSGGSLEAIARATFPRANFIPLRIIDEFLVSDKADALLWTKSEATTWCLINPSFTAVVPTPSLGNEHYAYAFRPNSSDFRRFVNYVLELKQLDGFTQDQYDYWILGKPREEQPRWSIIRDVLHWVE